MNINKTHYKVLGEPKKIYLDMTTLEIREKLNIALKNPTCEVPNKLGYTLKDICIAIEEVAHKYSIPVLDLYNTSNYEKVDCGMYAEGSDGWHPLKEFVSDYMAPQIAQFIKDNYK